MVVVLDTNFKIWCRDVNPVHQSDAHCLFVCLTHQVRMCLRLFDKALKLKKGWLRKLHNWLKILDADWSKCNIYIHSFRVGSLADVHSIMVDFNKLRVYHLLCMLPNHYRIENVTFNSVLNENTVRFCVSGSDILEQTMRFSR